ncbi:hypothetical protein D4759_06725 [Clostridiales bacterium AHG0011]|nr:hypothetical protein [Clostridiales bacterium AHG0011]
MNALDLEPEKKKKYDALLAEMMQEIERELEKLPERKKAQLDGPHDKVYRDVTKKYLPKIKEIIGASE